MHPHRLFFQHGANWIFRIFSCCFCTVVLFSPGLVLSLHAASARVVITPVTGYTITWDGNNGGFFSPDPGAGPSNNIALASNGAVAFTSSDLGPLLNIAYHRATNLNDGLYGNSHSWISANGVGGNSDPDPFCGISFSADAFTPPVNITSIAWSRDNGDTTAGDSGCGGTCTDRTIGTYTLQYTSLGAPDANTADTGDDTTGWATIGTVQYLDGVDDATFTSYLRHRFDIAQGGNPISATGIRVKVSDGHIDIDEIEVNPMPDPIPPISNFVDIVPASGFSIAWDRNEGAYSTTNSPAPAPVNDASVSRGAVAFGSSELNLGVHFIHNVNDGFYGNTHSWIPDFLANPDPAPFIGIKFAGRIFLRNIAWGRDNGDVAGDCCGGTLKDRALGLYTLQVTTVSNPGPATPEACGLTPDGGWVTIGTINYKSDNAAFFNSYLRHRFDVTQNGSPILATGIRIKVPNNQSDIDEIEVNANSALESKLVRITNSPGFTISWDGNDGQFNDPATGAAPPPNQGLASEGAVPFASSELGPIINVPFHRAVNLNDGLYGNSHSWISANGVGGTSDPDPFAGMSFRESISITNIAWSRDNGDASEGTFTDRSIDTYRLQYTTVSAPDANTPETGDDSTGWADIGTVSYTAAAPPFFTPYLRHRFDLARGGSPITASGVRIKVANGNTDIDEIEVNTSTTPPPAPPLIITPATGFTIVWDGNDGQFADQAPGAAAPLNRALASAGSTAFGSSELGVVLSIPFHRFINVNDGLYGNSHSWISANGIGGNSDPDPFVGVNFNDFVGITNVAWSRDNGDASEGTFRDRVVGIYKLQYTQVLSADASTPETADPSTGWADIGSVEYRNVASAQFTPYLRHRFDVQSEGAPIDATALRIKVSDGNTDIDEIEVNTPAVVTGPHLIVAGSGADVIISWSGGGGLEWAYSVTGPWNCLPDAVSPYTVTGAPGPLRFYRARR